MNDPYTKVILTIIAACLIGLLLRPIITPKTVTAFSQATDVNIVRVGGHLIGSKVPVK